MIDNFASMLDAHFRSSRPPGLLAGLVGYTGLMAVLVLLLFTGEFLVAFCYVAVVLGFLMLVFRHEVLFYKVDWENDGMLIHRVFGMALRIDYSQVTEIRDVPVRHYSVGGIGRAFVVHFKTSASKPKRIFVGISDRAWAGNFIAHVKSRMVHSENGS